VNIIEKIKKLPEERNLVLMQEVYLLIIFLGYCHLKEKMEKKNCNLS
jgi:hypothetical protein